MMSNLPLLPHPAMIRLTLPPPPLLPSQGAHAPPSRVWPTLPRLTMLYQYTLTPRPPPPTCHPGRYVKHGLEAVGAAASQAAMQKAVTETDVNAALAAALTAATAPASFPQAAVL